MEDSKLYSTQDIENLKQKIAIYRDTLNSLKAGNPVEAKDETENIKKEEYGERVKNISVQIESINQTVEVLSQDISVIMDLLKSEEVNDLIESINTLVDLHDSINIANENDEKESEMTINHTETIASPIPTTTLPLSYKQLRNFFHNANDVQEISADPEPIVNTSMVNKSIGRRGFPSVGGNSSKKSHGQSRSFHTKPTNTLNRVVLKQAIPLKGNISPSISFTTYDTQPEENTTDMKSFDIVQKEAVIEELENKSELIVEEKIEQVIEVTAETEAEDKVDMIVEDETELVEEDAVVIVVEDKVDMVTEDKTELIVKDEAETILENTIEPINEVVEESTVKEQPESKTKNRDIFAFLNFFQKKG